jgi:Domain of unknown function (DUF4234)
LEDTVSSLPTGPLGKRRGTLFVILVGIVTFGIYWIYWAFKTHDEMKRHTGEGLGGVVGLVVYILISPVTAFGAVRDREYVRTSGEDETGDRLDRSLDDPVRSPHHPGVRLDREDPGGSQPVLGGGSGGPRELART